MNDSRRLSILDKLAEPREPTWLPGQEANADALVRNAKKRAVNTAPADDGGRSGFRGAAIADERRWRLGGRGTTPPPTDNESGGSYSPRGDNKYNFVPSGAGGRAAAPAAPASAAPSRGPAAPLGPGISAVSSASRRFGEGAGDRLRQMGAAASTPSAPAKPSWNMLAQGKKGQPLGAPEPGGKPDGNRRPTWNMLAQGKKGQPLGAREPAPHKARRPDWNSMKDKWMAQGNRPALEVGRASAQGGVKSGLATAQIQGLKPANAPSGPAQPPSPAMAQGRSTPAVYGAPSARAGFTPASAAARQVALRRDQVPQGR